MADRLPLHNQVVAISGRMISMSHADAADLIASLGGRLARHVTRLTTILVIGEDGLPLGADGQPDVKLRRARELNDDSAAIEILPEAEFLPRLELDDVRVRRQYTFAELTRITGVRPNVIRSWVRHGLLAPVETRMGLQYFDFAQVSQLRTLSELSSSGVHARQVRSGLEELSRWLDDERPLELLTAVESHRRQLIVRLHDGRLAETGGQLLFDFSDEDEKQLLGLPTAPLFDRAVEYEEAGELELAATVYQEILDRGNEEPETRFNLANLLYTLGRVDESIELFEQALDRDPKYAAAWNNLGSALLDAGRDADAIEAFRRAVDIRPTYADARFNLANALDENQQADEARDHWIEYVKLSDQKRRPPRGPAPGSGAQHVVEDDADETPHILRFDAGLSS